MPTAKTKRRKGIGYSSLSDRVYLGVQDKQKGMWIGEKEDITGDFYGVMFQILTPNTVRITEDKTNIIFNVSNDPKSIDKAIKYLEKLKTEI